MTNAQDQYIVTVRGAKNPAHDPRHGKLTGRCDFSPVCTDVTGEHHSFLVCAPSAQIATAKVRTLGYHVTRVEEAQLLELS